MNRILKHLCFLLFLTLPLALNAAPPGGGGGEDLKGVCELSGGTFTGSESANWACCWPDWGCYGCVDGNCKMKCNTTRCRRANGMAVKNTGGTLTPIKGLAPNGMKEPVVPSKYLKDKSAVPASMPSEAK